MKRPNIYSIVSKLAVLLFAVSLCGFAKADTFLNTLAWTRYLNGYNGAIGTDELGNTYVIYAATDAADNTLTDIRFVRYDISGNAAALSTPLTVRGDVQIHCVVPSKIIDGKRHVCVMFTNIVPMAYNAVQAFGVTDSGVFEWGKVFGGNMTFSYQGLNGGIDSNNHFIVGMNMLMASPAIMAIEEFETAVFDLAGVVQSDSFDLNMNPNFAELVGGKWNVSGFSTSASAPARWASVDPSTGTESGFAEYPSVTSGQNQYYYSLHETADAAGFSYVAVTVQLYTNGVHQLTDHFIRKYRPNGSVVWTSKSFVGAVDSVKCASPGGNIWLAVDNGSYNRNLEQFDPNGNQLTKTLSFYTQQTTVQVPDSTGDYVLANDAGTPKRVIADRVDSTGTLQWTVSTNTTVGPQGYQSAYVSALLTNGNLYACGYLPFVTQFAVQRFVRGSTITALTGGSVKSGLTFSLKMSLSAPAPAGGLAVKLTSNNAKLLFPNNTTIYTAAIPVGSVYGLVTLHAATVTASTAVTITGNQNGVVRPATVTITP
jgi:hypothetical protein